METPRIKTVVSLTLTLDIPDARMVFEALDDAVEQYPGVDDPDEPGPLIAAICNAWLLDRAEKETPSDRPAKPSPIAITPDVHTLLARLESKASDFEDPNKVPYLPVFASDLRKAVELIRFGANATGQPNAGGGQP